MTDQTFQPDPDASLSIGVIDGGSAPQYRQRWHEALKALAKQVMSKRQGCETPLNVNVIFHIPGSHLSPDFQGLRTGSFSKAANTLIVQVALPEEPPGDIDEYLRTLLIHAVEEAEGWFQRKHPDAELAQLRRLVREV